MADCGKDIVLKREGTDQDQRFIKALSPGSVKLNDFGLEDWMKFAYRFAEHLNFFSTGDDKTPAGDWTKFFVDDNNLQEFVEKVQTLLTNQEPEGDINPNLALFVSFIRLLELSQKRFNQLTKKHLDFYYQEILQIEKLPATPDKVHVIFELAKNAVSKAIPEGTELDGGKDKNGTKRIYETERELIANKTLVGQLKSVYHTTEKNKLKSAPKANSYDGEGADFPKDEIKWWPFGYYKERDESLEKDNREYPELPDAKTGFAISSEILELQEGERNVLITAEFNKKLSGINSNDFSDILEIYCTGEKNWLGPFDAETSLKEKSGKTIFSSGTDSLKTTLKLAFRIPKEEAAVTTYNQEIHGENFSGSNPVCRILINTGKNAGYNLFSQLNKNQLKKLTVDVDVKGVKNLSLQNDTGIINVKKPFYPFGTQPVVRSNFTIDYPELFKKNWENFHVDIKWKNTPVKIEGGSDDPFKELYYAYREDYLYKSNPQKYLIGMFFFYNGVFGDFDSDPGNLIVKSKDYFTSKVEILNKEEWEKVKINEEENLVLFKDEKDNGEFTADFAISNKYESGKTGPVRMSLNKSFLHELFPRIYALAFSSEKEDALIPNEPYTPMIEEISLNYTAKSEFKQEATETTYKNNDLRLFHEHPFGQSEQHPFLKKQLNWINENEKLMTAVPTFEKGGELYIGMKNAKPGQIVSLLVQVLEGSENPEAESFAANEKISWSVLCQNEWMTLKSESIILNETDNFLKSGIVRFSLPKETTDQNTRLPKDFTWIKVRSNKEYSAVSKIIGIFTQAALASFSDQGNELSHLKNGLPSKTISKMVNRISTVKGVSQPFSSFGGVPAESDTAYYRRISERLRHKNRAVTVWDYEHLVLQEFPEIYKVKCLNHTSDNSFLSPGNVRLVVIPDIVNQNVFDIYEPRVSQAKLNEIAAFVNNLNSLHVNAVVINPVYEEVKVSLKVKFYKGYDENYYKNVLQTDITKMLSPWAFDNKVRIDFGISMHRSALINYIEKLNYVDYIEEVELSKEGVVQKNVVAPSSPKAILVSAKEHAVDTEQKKCPEISET
jgi:hypothetical protein